jgi:hypothetical protein
LSGQNQPSSHIELTGKDFSWYESEKEVLLAPFFTFQVVDMTESKKDELISVTLSNGKKKTFYTKITTVTLVELSYQDILKTR